MSAHKIGPFLGALVILLVGITLGDWDQYQGLGGLTPLAFAQEAAGKDDDRDDDRDDKKLDHFACYKVKCLKKGNHKGGDQVVECPKEYEKVILFNQFTGDDDDHRPKHRDDEGLKVVVEQLDLLCVPTKKVHNRHNRKD